MKQVFRIAVMRWTTVVGAILTIISVALVTSLSLNAFAIAKSAAAVSRNSLAGPEVVDASAQAKYVAKLTAEKEAAEEVASEKAAAESASAASRNQTAKATPKTTPIATAQPTTYSYNRLIIPKIGLSTALATVGLTAAGAVDVNSSTAAWFNQSAAPGTTSGVYSATFVDGHNPGIFSRLGALAAGDQITISLANGAGDYTYTVCAAETVNLASVDMSKALSRQCGGSQGLNLMTCEGAYTGDTRAQRLIVYAGR